MLSSASQPALYCRLRVMQFMAFASAADPRAIALCIVSLLLYWQVGVNMRRYVASELAEHVVCKIPSGLGRWPCCSWGG